MMFFDDIVLNQAHHSPATFTITADDIKQFASQWDPMPFHIDETLAAQSPLGKLFASSVHSVAIGIRLSHSMMDKEVAVVAGLGWQDVRFPAPVCAGDTLRLRTEVVEKRLSQSKPDRGLITTLNTLLNQHDVIVAEYKIVTMVLCKPD